MSGLTHWGRVTHICVSKLTIIGSDNGLSPGRRQAIIWTNAGILLSGSLGTNFSEILIGIQTFSFNKLRLKMSPAKWCPFCLGLNMLRCLTHHTQRKYDPDLRVNAAMLYTHFCWSYTHNSSEAHQRRCWLCHEIYNGPLAKATSELYGFHMHISCVNIWKYDR